MGLKGDYIDTENMIRGKLKMHRMKDNRTRARLYIDMLDYPIKGF